MARRRHNPIAVAVSYEQPPYENGHFRAVAEPKVTVPGNQSALVGGYDPWDANKSDTVLQGHPEAAAQYTHDYDHRDPYLEGGETRRMDLNYVSPEDIRRKSKGNMW